MNSVYYNVRTLARLLDISEQTVYQHAKNGLIPGTLKVGGSIRFNQSIIHQWLNEQERKEYQCQFL